MDSGRAFLYEGDRTRPFTPTPLPRELKRAPKRERERTFSQRRTIAPGRVLFYWPPPLRVTRGGLFYDEAEVDAEARPPPDRVDRHRDHSLVPDTLVAVELGVSTMTVWRWDNEDAEARRGGRARLAAAGRLSPAEVPQPAGARGLQEKSFGSRGEGARAEAGRVVTLPFDSQIHRALLALGFAIAAGGDVASLENRRDHRRGDRGQGRKVPAVDLAAPRRADPPGPARSARRRRGHSRGVAAAPRRGRRRC